MSGITITADSATQFETGAAEFNSACRLDDTNFAVAYRDNNDGNKGKVNVGSRSGTSITISEANAVVFNNDATTRITIRAFSSTKFVISYCDTNSGKRYVIAGSVSGTTITLGTAVEAYASTGGATSVSVAVLDSTNFVVSFYADRTGFGNFGISHKVGSISGTTITLGAKQETGASGDNVSSVGLDATHFVYTYRLSSMYGRAATVDTAAQTVTTLGTELELIGSSDEWPQLDAFDSTHIIVASALSSDNTIKVLAASINLTTLAITAGTAITTANTTTSELSICAISALNFILSYYTSTGTQGEVISGTVSGGTTAAFDAQGAVVFDNSTSAYTALCRLTDNYFLLAYKRG